MPYKGSSLKRLPAIRKLTPPHAPFVLSKARAPKSASCASLRARIRRAGRRWIDRKAAGEAVRDRAITSQPRALQGAAQCDLRLVSQSLTHIESFLERLRTG